MKRGFCDHTRRSHGDQYTSISGYRISVREIFASGNDAETKITKSTTTSTTQQGTPTRGKRTGASIKTSRPVNVTTKTGYNNTHKENARMIGASGRRPSKGRVQIKIRIIIVKTEKF
jgi:hypothetical protein